jgi:hypothetical protein
MAKTAILEKVAVSKGKGKRSEKIVVSKKSRKRKRGPSRRSTGRHTNLWLASLRDPENVVGSKIPDPIGVPTGVFQLTADLTYPVGANGDFAISVFPQGGNFYISTTNTAAGTITWSAALALAGKATASTIYDGVRVVSGIMKVEFVGNSLYDQGQILGTWLPHGDGATTFTTFNVAQSNAYSQTFPLRNGCYVLWRPEDNSDLEFGQGSFVGNSNSLLIWATGAYATVPPQLRVRIVLNYEGVAEYDTTNFITTTTTIPSISDINDVMLWAQYLGDKVGVVQGVFDPRLTQLTATMPIGARPQVIGGPSRSRSMRSRPMSQSEGVSGALSSQIFKPGTQVTMSQLQDAFSAIGM